MTCQESAEGVAESVKQMDVKCLDADVRSEFQNEMSFIFHLHPTSGSDVFLSIAAACCNKAF